MTKQEEAKKLRGRGEGVPAVLVDEVAKIADAVAVSSGGARSKRARIV